jgi:hypothetical protein
MRSALELAQALEFAPLPIRDAHARELAPPTLVRVIFGWRRSADQQRSGRTSTP